ncbi:MAG: sialate O-acetylesterase [Akkermansiaceae bacterium]
MNKLLISMTLGVLPGILTAAPMKVYILSGQSNMEGHAKISSFDHIGMDPKTAPILKEMRNQDGSSKVFENIRISYRTGKEDQPAGMGPLTSGFGARKDPTQDGGKIGPELTFGIYTEKLVKEPILIIKTAWGGKSIHTDFRPPSAGPYVFRDDQIEQFKKQGKDVEQVKADRAAATGKYYRLMMNHVKAVLKDPKNVHPAYDPKEGYELAGFVWFQGWNDMVARDVYPQRDKPGGYDDYSKVLAHFIRDVRKDLDAPEMPFVIGVMGAGGPTSKYEGGQKRYAGIHENFRQAMAAPAKMPEFKGNVTAVLTEKYWDPELDEVAEKRNLVNAKSKELKSKGLSKEELAKEIAAFTEKTLTPRDHELLKGITNADYHYKGSGKIMAQIGKAFAEAVYELNQK